MQRVTVRTHLTGREDGRAVQTGHETFTLTRRGRWESWQLHGAPFTLFEIRPGQTYTLTSRVINRVVEVSPVESPAHR